MKGHLGAFVRRHCRIIALIRLIKIPMLIARPLCRRLSFARSCLLFSLIVVACRPHRLVVDAFVFVGVDTALQNRALVACVIRGSFHKEEVLPTRHSRLILLTKAAAVCLES